MKNLPYLLGISCATLLASCALKTNGSDSLQNRKGPSASEQCQRSKDSIAGLEKQIDELSKLIETQKADGKKILEECQNQNTEVCVNPFGGQNLIDKERQLKTLENNLQARQQESAALCKTASETPVSASRFSYGKEECFVYVGKSEGRLANDSRVAFGNGQTRVPFIAKKVLAFTDGTSFEADLIPAQHSNAGILIKDVDLSIHHILSPNETEKKLCDDVRNSKQGTSPATAQKAPEVTQDSSAPGVIRTPSQVPSQAQTKCHVFKVKAIKELQKGAPYFYDKFASRTLGFVGPGKRVYLRLTEKDTLKVKVIDTSSAAYGIEAYMLKTHLTEACD